MMISITNLEQLINGQFAKFPPCAGQAELGQRKLRILDLDDEAEGGDDGDEHDDDGGGAGKTWVNANSDPSTLGVSIMVMKSMMMVVMTMMVMKSMMTMMMTMMVTMIN